MGSEMCIRDRLHHLIAQAGRAVRLIEPNVRCKKCHCYSICRSSFRRACARSRRAKRELPQGTDGPVCRSPYGADLWKGNHLVCRLPTLSCTALRGWDESSMLGMQTRVWIQEQRELSLLARRDALVGTATVGAVLRTRTSFSKASQPETQVNFDVPENAYDRQDLAICQRR